MRFSGCVGYRLLLWAVGLVTVPQRNPQQDSSLHYGAIVPRLVHPSNTTHLDTQVGSEQLDTIEGAAAGVRKSALNLQAQSSYHDSELWSSLPK
ncbi:hypothetical protein F4859DRAFT_494071 [Xylaria cf. heliscus]|nr:hypothetical protein F4859DRAFT_494071 [Xylaria cf. heliscus]